MLRKYGFKFFKYFIEDRSAFAKYFILSFMVGIAELLGVALIYPFIKNILSGSGFGVYALFTGIIIIVAFIAKNVFMIFYNSLHSDYTKTCEANISKKFMNFFVYGDYSVISSIPLEQKQFILGFLISYSVNNYLIRVLNLFVNSFIFVLISVFLFAKFFLATGITVIVAIIVISAQSLFFKYKTKIVSEKMNSAQKSLNADMNNSFLDMKIMKVMSAEDYFFKKYLLSLDKYREASKSLLFYNSISPYITEPLVILLLFLMIAIVSYQNLNNPAVLAASYAVIAGAVFRLAPTISRMQVNITGVQAALPQLKALIDYYEQFNLSGFLHCNSIKQERFASGIELRNVEFAYDSKTVLNNINLKINKGEFIGLTGASGAGKTTLVDIIAGMLRIKTGELYLDGKFINDTVMPHLKIGYIPQEFRLLPVSIRENVALSRTDIDDDKVIECLKKAQLYDYVESSCKNGIYDSPFINNTGFSQGQKQRLSIARALYADPDILIFDEATSALDLNTEAEICRCLEALRGEKTVIAVAHRLSTIKNADRIIFMNNSTISDSGTFDELIERCPDFENLVRLNSTDFIH